MTEPRGKLEYELLNNHTYLCGTDEVGRGCLAGPTHGAAVILDYQKLASLDESEKKLIRDSKKLSSKQRQKIIPVIKDIAVAWAIGSASAREIETLGLNPAIFTAIHRSISALNHSFDCLLMDGKQKVPGIEQKQITVIGGDHSCYSIAAASILAKEARDTYMQEAAALYPEYGFEAHVGYGTKKHTDAMEKHGICVLHRRNFRPVQRYL